MPDADEVLAREALRLYRRYQIEAVEGWGLCPYAARAREEGNVRERVIVNRDPDVTLLLDAVDAFGADPEVHIGLLILPRCTLDFRPFEALVKRVQADAEARGPGRSPLALAAFHPGAEPDFSAPHRLIPHLRRTPDPVIQCVRLSVLERVRRGDGGGTLMVDPDSFLAELAAGRVRPARPVYERIAEANLDHVGADQGLGFSSLLADIHRDRRETYGRLGEA